jgi:hypothetical protein
VLMYASSREHDEAAHRASRDDLDNEPDRKPPEEN